MSRIVMSVWDRRISPVFETCSQLMVAESDSWPLDVEVFATFQPHEPESARVLKTIESKAQILICGAISRLYLNMIAATSMQIIPYITGEIDSILQAYIQHRLDAEEFRLPGCRRLMRRKRRRGRETV